MDIGIKALEAVVGFITTQVSLTNARSDAGVFSVAN
jgi:hypothetical protein